MNIRKITIYSLILAFAAFSVDSASAGDPKKKKKKKRKHREVEVVDDIPPKPAAPKSTAAYPYSAMADPFARKTYNWADSVFRTLTPRERIGQLFMVGAYSNGDEKHFRHIDSLVQKYHIGGLIFMQGGPVRQAILTNRWQSMANVPLMLSMDAEWGLGMRLDSVPKFPKQMALGALPDDSLIYLMGAEIARECRRIGMQVNFAPVVDVNNNPSNPVINMRSFGEDKKQVTRRALAYMRGMQDNKVLATGKHFPGHGDTDADSHLALPVINYPRRRLDTLELYPFRELFAQGLGSVMVAHLYIPSLDTTTNLASTLSPKVVKDLLQNDLKFRGLIFTDALNMKGVTSYYQPGQVDVKALLAGNDMLLFAENVPLAISLIDSALMRGEISQAEIDAHCMKILKVKEWTELNRRKPVELKDLYKDLNTPYADMLNRQMKRQAVTVIRNNGQLPLVSARNTACLVIGEEKLNVFQKTLGSMGNYTFFNVPKSPADSVIRKMADTLRFFDRIVVAVTNTNIVPKRNFGFSDEGVRLVDTLAGLRKTSLVLFANPYALQKLRVIDALESVVVAYQDDEETQLETAQVISGKVSPVGKLPVTVDLRYTSGTGLSYKSYNSLGYAHPEEMGMDAVKLQKIDSLVKIALKDEAFPGCQVLAARKGKIIYQKNFGFYTYEKKVPVENNSIYDLASLTKVLATTISVMELADKGRLDVNKTLGDYLGFIPKGHPHAAVTIKDAMLHQAGFPAWIPFYEKYIVNDTVRAQYFTEAPDASHTWRVAEDMYVNPAIKSAVFQAIWDSKLNPGQGYKYSDIGFYYMREVVEAISGEPLEKFVDEKFYTPMNLPTLGYRPLDRFEKSRIVPTEYDETFRRQLVQGDVHDQGAALLGGVSGHAGLFGTSYDVAAVMQMLLNEGDYQGKRYLKPETVRLFTRTFDPANAGKNRRGLGFDKPVRDGSNGPTFNGISFESYGHSGFTGTFAWADPEEEIVYVFLSNRVYPTSANNKLVKLGLRSNIQQAIYEAIRTSYK
jgi:beta-N-acetylhexosaminidase